jgi:hypothetical protein
MTRNDVAWATFDSYPNLGPHAVRFQPVLRRFRKFLTHAAGTVIRTCPRNTWRGPQKMAPAQAPNGRCMRCGYRILASEESGNRPQRLAELLNEVQRSQRVKSENSLFQFCRFCYSKYSVAQELELGRSYCTFIISGLTQAFLPLKSAMIVRLA